MQPSLPTRLRLYAVAFLAGWVIMAMEIGAARLLAPQFGYSIYQWGALIGVVMSGMALGYLIGGRVGDSSRAAPVLAGFLGVSAAFLAVAPGRMEAIFGAVATMGPIRGAVAACVLLVGLPSVLLAATSPVVIRLTAGDRIATSSGRVFAASTVGSIGGTFFTAFHSIPVWGTTATLRVADGLLILALLLLLPSVRGAVAAGVAATVLMLAMARPGPPPPSNVIYETESAYGLISVQDFGGAKAMLVDHAVSSLQPGEGLLTGSYDDFALLAAHLAPGRDVLVLGVAGGNALTQLVRTYPSAQVTGVDVDPTVLEVAREHFAVGSLERTRLVADDARRFLLRDDDRYDVVFVDLFKGQHVPWFATTVEFFTLLRSRLNPGGVLLMNVVSAGGEAFAGPLTRTVQAVFPSVYRLDQSVPMVLATESETTLEGLRERLVAGRTADVDQVLERGRLSLRTPDDTSAWPVLTDDRNDIELRAFAAH